MTPFSSRISLTPHKGRLTGVQLQRALRFIDESLEAKLRNREVARIVGLSEYHFGKLFKQTVGMTLHAYMLFRRIEYSEKLLANSALPLAEISAAAGFANQSHFTSVFSTQIGMSPGLYREVSLRKGRQDHIVAVMRPTSVG